MGVGGRFTGEVRGEHDDKKNDKKTDPINLFTQRKLFIMETLKKYSVEFAGIPYEVKPFNEKYLQSLFSILSDLRDPSSDSFAIEMLKNVAVSNLPDTIAYQVSTDPKWFQWNPFISFDEIFAFVAQVLKCQRLYIIDHLTSKQSLDQEEQARLELAKESLARINDVIAKGKVEDEGGISEIGDTTITVVPVQQEQKTNNANAVNALTPVSSIN